MVCAFLRRRGNGDFLPPHACFEAKLARLSACLASGPAVQREALHVDSCRRGSNSRPDRLLDPSHVIQYCYGTHPPQSQSKFNPARDRRVGLLAIGQCLKEQYDALTTPMPRHLAALVQQLEMQR